VTNGIYDLVTNDKVVPFKKYSSSVVVGHFSAEAAARFGHVRFPRSVPALSGILLAVDISTDSLLWLWALELCRTWLDSETEFSHYYLFGLNVHWTEREAALLSDK